VWSPDGKLFLGIDPRGGILVYALNGGAPQKILPHYSPFGIGWSSAWSSDGRVIFLTYADSICALPVKGGQVHASLRMDDPSHRFVARNKILENDGQLYFILSTPESDVWVMELRSKG
jgi:hypothetical protein